MRWSLFALVACATAARADVSLPGPPSVRTSCAAAIERARRRAMAIEPELERGVFGERWFHFMHDGRFLNLSVFPSPSAPPSGWQRFDQDGVVHRVRQGVGLYVTLTLNGWDEETRARLIAEFARAGETCTR